MSHSPNVTIMMTMVTNLHLQYAILTSMFFLYVHATFGIAAHEHAGPSTLTINVVVLSDL